MVADMIVRWQFNHGSVGFGFGSDNSESERDRERERGRERERDGIETLKQLARRTTICDRGPG